MISEFSTHVKSSNNNARILFFSLLGASVAIVIAYTLSPLYKGVIGMCALIAIVAAVFVYTKFLSSVFYYDITFDYRGEPIFVVRQITGKRQSTLARLSLRDIRKIEMETRAQRKAHKVSRGFKKYTYFPTLSPDESCRLTVISSYEKSEVQIECTKEFSEMLRAYCVEAKTYVISEDEDYEEKSENTDEN